MTAPEQVVAGLNKLIQRLMPSELPDAEIAVLVAAVEALTETNRRLDQAMALLRDNCTDWGVNIRTCSLCDYTWRVEDREEQHAPDCFLKRSNATP